MVELRNRQVHQMPPAAAGVNAAPQSAVISAVNDLGVAGINPNRVMVAVSIRHGIEALAAVHALQQDEIGLENFVLVFGIDNKVRKVKRTPHQILAGIKAYPFLAALIEAQEHAVLRF